MKQKDSKLKKLLQILIPILLAVIVITVLTQHSTPEDTSTAAYTESVSHAQSAEGSVAALDVAALPEYDGAPYITVNDTQPDFLEKDLTTEAFEYYGQLDYLGRCTACFACIGQELMPTEKRGSISSVKPTGWHSTNYSNVDGGSLYNRCHLIAYQLTAENANNRNLITGTCYMNATGIEEKTGDYIRTTGNHVIYRVTPIFVGDELVARGVQMEAMSVEDQGEGVCFNVYCFNVQPGIEIDYLTGDSTLADDADAAETTGKSNAAARYVLNTKSKKFHKPDCAAVGTISEDNRQEVDASRQSLIDEGYTPCGQCNP